MSQEQQPVFVVDPDPVRWPVVVEGIPVDGGRFGSFGFTAAILVLPESDYREILSEAKDSTEMTAEEALTENARLLPKLVVGWEGPVDRQRNAVPFTPEALAAQLTGRYGRQLGAALWRAVQEVRYGVRLGNSVPPPAAGSESAVPAAPTSSTAT